MKNKLSPRKLVVIISSGALALGLVAGGGAGFALGTVTGGTTAVSTADGSLPPGMGTGTSTDSGN